MSYGNNEVLQRLDDYFLARRGRWSKKTVVLLALTQV
jgi:hypothetical protein